MIRLAAETTSLCTVVLDIEADRGGVERALAVFVVPVPRP